MKDFDPFKDRIYTHQHTANNCDCGDTLIAIDPGNVESAMVIWNGKELLLARYEPNDVLLGWFVTQQFQTMPLVIERVACYGMAVGESVFETVYWSGRLAQAYHGPVERLLRMDVKMHLCHSSRAKDKNIRQALIDRFGLPGTKKKPGLTYGISGDLWAALAVAVTAWDQKFGGSK